VIEAGTQIKAARALLDWSQTDLAKAINRHKNAVAYWEGKAAITKRHQAGWQSGPRVIEQAFGARGVVFLPSPELGVKHAGQSRSEQPCAGSTNSAQYTRARTRTSWGVTNAAADASRDR